jgi:hypothetical protein
LKWWIHGGTWKTFGSFIVPLEQAMCTRFLAVEPLGLMGSLEVFQLHRKPGLMNFADTEPEEIYPESVKNEHQ